MEFLDELGDRPSRAACIFAAICCILFIILGCIGNATTILALARSRKLRNATTAFVISLACADLCFCIVNLPLTAIRYIQEKWVLGDTMCIIFPFFFYGNVGASLLSMTAITFNRLVSINWPQLYSKIYRTEFVALMILFAWSFSFLVLLPTLLGVWGKFGYHESSFSCTILPSDDGVSPKKALFIISFILPVIVIITSYSCIFYKVHKAKVNVQSHDTSMSPKSSQYLNFQKDEIRLTKMMLIIFFTFLLCFLPLLVANVAGKNIRSPILHILSSVLAWMSSCTNCFIYAILNRNYRQAYAQFFTKIFVCKKSNREKSILETSSRSNISPNKELCPSRKKSINVMEDVL